MSNRNKNIWSNGWIVGTGTAILSVLLLRIIDSLADTTILKSIWIFIKNTIKSIGLFLNKSYSLPIWILFLLSISGLVLTLIIIWIGSLFRKEKELTTIPIFLNYKSDTFDGVLYKWEYVKDYYNTGKYIITNFVAYCPKDNCIILYNRCQICNTYYGSIKNNEELEVLIRHRIDNNLFSNQQKA